MERAYAKVTTALDFVPPDKPLVYLTPALSLNPDLQRPGVLASADPESRIINMHSIESFGAGFYDPAAGPLADMYPTITHEYTHVVNRYIVPLVRMKKWMSEGLAEYTSDSFRPREVQSAIRSGRVMTLEQAHEAIFFGQEKNFTPAQQSLAYGIGAYAVRLIMETYGSQAFWALAKEYDKTRDWDSSVMTAFGISYAEFQDKFNGWLPGAVEADLARGVR